MKKAEQLAINDEVMDALDFYNEHCVRTGEYIRLYSCQADVFDVVSVSTGQIIGQGLRSYNTIVAICINGILYDFLRYVYGYTATSAQHIAKFAKFEKASIVLHYKPV